MDEERAKENIPPNTKRVPTNECVNMQQWQMIPQTSITLTLQLPFEWFPHVPKAEHGGVL